MTKPDNRNASSLGAQKRRLALKTLSGSALVGGLADKLPGVWQRPLVHAAVLPAHAQNSPLPNRILLRVSGAGGGQATLSIPFELMRDGADDVITRMVFSANQRVEIVHVSSPTLLDELFPVAYAQGPAATQAATTPGPGQAGTTVMPSAIRPVLSLTEELVLDFLTTTPGGIPSTPMPLHVATGDLKLGYPDTAGGTIYCDDFEITVTLLEDRSAVESIVTSGMTSSCGSEYTIAEVPPEDEEHYEASGLGARTTSVSFASATEMVTEGQPLSVELVKDGDAAVTFRITRGRGTAADSDYVPSTGMGNLPAAATGTPEASYPFDTDLVFPAGQSTLTLDLTATSDTEVESPETLVLQLEVIEASRGYARVGSIEEITITIIDVPITRLQFGLAEYSGNQNSTVTVVVTKAGDSAADVEVTADFTTGMAEVGDITSPTFPVPLSFTATETEKTFDVVIAANSLADPARPETFTLGLDIDLTSASTGHELQPGSPSTAIFSIAELPVTEIEFAAATYSGAEGTNLTFVVNKAPVVSGDRASAVTFNITVAHTSSQAADLGTYNFNNLRIAAGATSRSFTLPLATDRLVESDETVTLTLADPRNPDTGHQVRLGMRSSTVVTITDVLPPTLVRFEQPTDTTHAEGDTFTIKLLKDGPSGARARVVIDPIARRADIASIVVGSTTHTGTQVDGFNIDFTTSETEQTFTVTLARDTLNEGNERLNLRISGLSNPTAGHNLEIDTPNSLALTITNQPPTRVGFGSAPDSATEGDTISIGLTKTGDSAVTFEVRLGGSGASRARPSDIASITYPGGTATAFPVNITLSQAQTSATLQVVLATNLATEGREQLTLLITNVVATTTGHAATTATSEIVINILDVTTPGPTLAPGQTTAAPLPITEIQFSGVLDTSNNPYTVTNQSSAAADGAMKVTVDEGDTIVFQVEKTGGAGVTFDILRDDASLADASDIAGHTLPGSPQGSDIYDRTGLRIAAGNNLLTDDVLETFALFLAHGDNTEGNETLIFDLANIATSDTGFQVRIGDIRRLEITITNIPETIVEFTGGPFSGAEGDVVSVGLTKSGPSAARVHIRTSPGTAVRGDIEYIDTPDGTTHTGTDLADFAFDLTAGFTTGSLSVGLARDALTEPDETLTLEIHSIDAITGQRLLIGGTSTANLTITNVEQTLVQFAAGSYSGREGGLVDVTLTKTGDTAVTFRVVASGDTADIDSVVLLNVGSTIFPVNVSMGVSDTSATLRLRFKADHEIEGTEGITLQITNLAAASPTATHPVALGGRSSANVDIIDVTTPAPIVLQTSVGFGTAPGFAIEGGTISIGLTKTGTSAVTFNVVLGSLSQAQNSDIASITLPGGGTATGFPVNIVLSETQTSATLQVVLATNPAAEGRELFNLLITNVVATTTGHTATTATNEIIITILDVTTPAPIVVPTVTTTAGLPITEIEFAAITNVNTGNTITIDNLATLASDGVLKSTVNEGDSIALEVRKTGAASVTFDILRDDTSQIVNLDIASHTLPRDRLSGSSDQYDRTGLHIEAGETLLTDNTNFNGYGLTFALGDNTEGNETLTFQLSNPSTSDTGQQVRIGDVGQLEITVANVPETRVEFTLANHTHVHAEGDVFTIGLTKTGDSAATVRILAEPSEVRGDIASIQTPDGITHSTIGSFFDFSLQASNYTSNLTVTLARDTLTESDETLTLNISRLFDPTSGHSLAVGTNRTASITITDVVPTAVGFAAGPFSGREGDTVDVILTKTGGLDTAVTFSVNATGAVTDVASIRLPDNSTATVFPFNVSLAASATSGTLQLTLKTDHEIEGTERITLQITNLTAVAPTADHVTRISQATANIDIIDVTTPAPAPITVIQFASASQTGAEGDVVNVVLTKTGLSAARVRMTIPQASIGNIASIRLPNLTLLTANLHGIEFNLPDPNAGGTLQVALARDNIDPEPDVTVTLTIAQLTQQTTGHQLQIGTAASTNIVITNTAATTTATPSGPPAPIGVEIPPADGRATFEWSWSGSGNRYILGEFRTAGVVGAGDFVTEADVNYHVIEIYSGSTLDRTVDLVAGTSSNTGQVSLTRYHDFSFRVPPSGASGPFVFQTNPAPSFVVGGNNRSGLYYNTTDNDWELLYGEPLGSGSSTGNTAPSIVYTGVPTDVVTPPSVTTLPLPAVTIPATVPPIAGGDPNAYTWSWEAAGVIGTGTGQSPSAGQQHQFRVEGRFVVNSTRAGNNEIYEEHLTEHVITIYRQENGTGDFKQYWKMEYGQNVAGGTRGPDNYLTSSADNPDSRNTHANILGRTNTNPANGTNWPATYQLHFQLYGNNALPYRQFFGSYNGITWLGNNNSSTGDTAATNFRLGPVVIRITTNSGSVVNFELADRNVPIARSTGRSTQPRILRETDTVHPDPEN